MRRLNVKLVVWLSTTSLVLVVLVGVVHAWQMKRTAKVLLVQAQAAEEEDDLEKAASFYRQYVAYVPDDAEEAAHMALLMADIAEQPGASNMQKAAPLSTRWRRNCAGTSNATTSAAGWSTTRS